ncbi:gem-associated protein 6-like [Coregonus clupeaformis]|uniref:gem-associated protein 6-like n=1 Tax=Coregonus clupeaformis TaxID=59861 RepID=UPI001E1C6EBD|nr:gem-associated protein 6-like [Coregonus clupeaformis]
MDEWRQLKPLEWCKYVNKEVKVTAHEKQQHNGWVFTVDPVSASIVLVTFQEKGGTPTVRVVTGHAVQEGEVLQEGNEEMAGRLRVVFTPPGARALGPEEVRRRKESLRLWLEKNRIPVEEEGEMLRVANVLTVSAPYGAEDCSSSNEIILARVQSLVESNPDSSPDQPANS